MIMTLRRSSIIPSFASLQSSPGIMIGITHPDTPRSRFVNVICIQHLILILLHMAFHFTIFAPHANIYGLHVGAVADTLPYIIIILHHALYSPYVQ